MPLPIIIRKMHRLNFRIIKKNLVFNIIQTVTIIILPRQKKETRNVNLQ